MHSTQSSLKSNTQVRSSTMPRLAFVALGSNLGDRWWILQGALQEITAIRGYRVLDVAPVWETPPWGETDQPHFLNTVVALEILDSTPEELLRAAQSIENRFGRVRAERWGPRTLDIDLLIWDEEVRTVDSLQVPHPRMREREFVMVPFGHLLEKHSEWEHPWLKEWRALWPAFMRAFGDPAGSLRIP